MQLAHERCNSAGPIDRALQAIVDAWGMLPEAVRVKIMALVRAASGEG